VHETGLLERLAHGGTAAELARDLGLDVRAVRIAADALVAHGHARRDGDRWTLTVRGAQLVAPGDGADPLGGALLEAREMAAQVRLADVLRTGAPRDDLSGGDPAARGRFMRAMRRVAAPRARATVAALPAPADGGRLLDVGGAPGSYAIPFARAGWDVTVVDLAETLEVTGALLDRAGVAWVAGDITAGLPPGEWDAVYLGNVVHLFGPADAEALVLRAGAALRPGGRLAVQEVVSGLADPAPGFGVTMLAGTREGEAYGVDDLRRWMRDAGCPVHAIVAVEPRAHHLLLGVRR
jgi:SAM-dependent methyltransferase